MYNALEIADVLSGYLIGRGREEKRGDPKLIGKDKWKD
jgi:hypothetical protein